MAATEGPMQRAGRFTPAADLLRHTIRKAGEKRGFATMRILTHWAEIVGEDLAAVTKPLEIRQPRTRKDGAAPQGGTLTVLALGAAALRIEMESDRIRDRINACHGYRAVERLRIRQTSLAGLAEARTPFTPPPATTPDPHLAEAAAAATEGVADTRLRLALATMAANVLRKSRP